ncbi:MAG: Crp/Fnr family transcriptional regulator [Gracilibacteraceae bacterium]|nr:Crp/Fnr family transcriptional regulator [Gracilibacteraceae bacterium]
MIRNNRLSRGYTDYPTRLLYLTRGIQRFERLGVLKNFRKDFILAEPGAIPLCCYAVKKGRVITYEYTNSGEERVYNFMEENSIMLEANLLMDKPVQVYFKTVKPSELFCIEKDSLLAAMQTDPQLMMDVVESLSYKFFAAMDQVRQTCIHDATWKLCNLLLIFADNFGVIYDGKILINEKISQQMLSNLLGINRITVVRIIKDLKNENLLEQINGLYCIRSTKRLKKYQDASATSRATFD